MEYKEFKDDLERFWGEKRTPKGSFLNTIFVENN